MLKKVLFMMSLVLLMASCSHRQARNEQQVSQKQISLANLVTDREQAKEAAYVDSVYLHMNDVAFVSVVKDLLDCKALDPAKINKEVIVNTYLDQKQRFDGIVEGYNMHDEYQESGLDDSIQTQVNQHLDSAITSNCQTHKTNNRR